MNEVLKILYIVCFIISILSFCVALFIFFKFRITEVVSDLNGTLTRQAIEKIRERNEHTKNYGAGLLDIGLGQTGKANKTDRIKSVEKKDNMQDGTTLLQSNKAINKDFVIIKSIVFVNTSENILDERSL